MMKIGDLVKYTPEMTGLQNCLGIVIGFNTDYANTVEVQWTGRVGEQHVPLYRGKEISTELTDFLEVVSEAR
jgi:hypothetical protein